MHFVCVSWATCMCRFYIHDSKNSIHFTCRCATVTILTSFSIRCMSDSIMNKTWWCVRCVCVRLFALIHNSVYAIFKLCDHSPEWTKHTHTNVNRKREKSHTDRLSDRPMMYIYGRTKKGMLALLLCIWWCRPAVSVCVLLWCCCFFHILILFLPSLISRRFFFFSLLAFVVVLFLFFVLNRVWLFICIFRTLFRTCDCNSFYFTKLTERGEWIVRIAFHFFPLSNHNLIVHRLNFCR